MKMIVAERREDLRPEEIIPGSSAGFFCSSCEREVMLTADSQRRTEDASICCVPCYKRIVIKGGLGYVSRLQQIR
jgi:DNA-directed RNA polymerase subunit RPC12/RpoP